MVHGKWDSYTLFFFRHLNHVQGAYYLINGVWPLLSIGTFQAITGPKTDLWLVETVGLFLMINGLILMLAAYRRQTVGQCSS